MEQLWSEKWSSSGLEGSEWGSAEEPHIEVFAMFGLLGSGVSGANAAACFVGLLRLDSSVHLGCIFNTRLLARRRE